MPEPQALKATATLFPNHFSLFCINTPVASYFASSTLPVSKIVYLSTMTLGLARPTVPSPLASGGQCVPPAQRPVPKRGPSFPHSRALRPFPSIGKPVQSKQPVKLIQPPKNFSASFVLDLTQAEFSRQE